MCAQYRRSVPAVPSVPIQDSVLEKLIVYVEENYREDISLRSAAQAIGYNKSYLSRQLHQAIPMNFRSFVNFQRIQYVCRQIRVEKRSLTELALASGFQSLRSFNRAFQEFMNMPPRQYLSRFEPPHSP